MHFHTFLICVFVAALNSFFDSLLSILNSQAAAEAAEASVSPEEREVLHMAAGAVQVAEEATKTVKVAKDTERTFCKRS